MVKKKKDTDLMGMAKESVGLGVGSMAGMGVMGAMSGIPGMPCAASGIPRTVGAGLGLLNVGQVAKIGMGIGNMMGEQAGQRKGKTGDKRLDKMLGR